jgi:peptide/nickel transport system permease protein
MTTDLANTEVAEFHSSHKETLSPTGFRRISIKLFQNKFAIVAMFILFIVIFSSILLPELVTLEPEEMDFTTILAPPSADHIFGTDEAGRDVFARLVYGGRITLLVGFVSILVAVVLGILLGGISGFAGGAVDHVIMRFTDALMSLPLFFILLVVLSVFGTTIFNITVTIGATSWMVIARVVRGEVLKVRELIYVESARAMGATEVSVLIRHIIPQTLPSVIVGATLGLAYAILLESVLSYLGLGVQPPTPSWGNLLYGAQAQLWTHPRLAIIPGVMIFIVSLGFNFLGEGLRDSMDPTLR